MFVKRRLLVVIATAFSLVATAAAPVIGASYQEAKPAPLRQGNLLRVRDVAANGNMKINTGGTTKNGAVVAVGWREASNPGGLHVAFSVDGGKDYRRNNGNLRRYPVLGEPNLGMSVAVCGGRVWIGSAFHNPGDDAGDTDVLLTTRTVGGGAAQRFMTNTDGRRKVRDVQVACAGELIAVAWSENSNGSTKAKLLLRTMEPLSEVPVYSNIFGLGEARFKDGIAVAGTSKAIHVAYVKGDARKIWRKSYLISGDVTPEIEALEPVRMTSRDGIRPQLAARGSRVVLGYTHVGKVKVKRSSDRGENWTSATTLVSAGTKAQPSPIYSVDVYGDRIVAEAASNTNGKLTPQRVQSSNFGKTWGTRVFGHKGARAGALMKKKDGPVLVREAWHNNAASRDTLRAQFEKP